MVINKYLVLPNDTIKRIRTWGGYIHIHGQQDHASNLILCLSFCFREATRSCLQHAPPTDRRVPRVAAAALHQGTLHDVMGYTLLPEPGFLQWRVTWPSSANSRRRRCRWYSFQVGGGLESILDWPVDLLNQFLKMGCLYFVMLSE